MKGKQMVTELIAWLPFLVMLCVPFGLAGFLIWLAVSKTRGGQKQYAEVQKEVISKFTSGDELRAFLKSDEGKQLFRNMDSEGAARRGPRERAVSRIGIGIVLMIVGGGLLIPAHYADQSELLISTGVQPPPPGIGESVIPPAPPSEFISLPPGMGFPAVVLLLTGFGLVVSSVVTLKLNTAEASKL